MSRADNQLKVDIEQVQLRSPRGYDRMALNAAIRTCTLGLCVMATMPTCGGAPVNCREIGPDNCAKHPECFSFTAERLNEQCAFQQETVGCGPDSFPQCQQVGFFIRDPAGTCWSPDECFVPTGWTVDDGGVCESSRASAFAACFPRDGGLGETPSALDATEP